MKYLAIVKSLTMLTVGLGLLVVADNAWAQRGAGSKIDGEAYEAPYFYNSARTYQDNAYAHAEVLQEATSTGVAIPQAVAKEHTDAIRSNLQAAAKHHASLKAAAKGNAKAMAHLDEIDKHHKSAHALAGQIDAATAGGKGDAKAVNKLAGQAAQELKAAQDKHKALAEHLKDSKTGSKK